MDERALFASLFTRRRPKCSWCTQGDGHFIDYLRYRGFTLACNRSQSIGIPTFPVRPWLARTKFLNVSLRVIFAAGALGATFFFPPWWTSSPQYLALQGILHARDSTPRLPIHTTPPYVVGIACLRVWICPSSRTQTRKFCEQYRDEFVV